MKNLPVLLLCLQLISACNNPSSPDAAPAKDSTVAATNVSEKKQVVSGPEPNTKMTPSYVYFMGKQMYFWGWPLVNLHNRVLAMRPVPEPGLNGGAVPVAPVGRMCVLSDYITPDQRYVACPNQDVMYGASFQHLDESPTVIQVPDFGDRFWVVQLGNQRTDGIGGLGSMYGSKPGFYLVVGPDWKGEKPQGITEVFRSNTNIAYALPRAFLNNTPEDKEALRKVMNQMNAYPLSEFDGKYKTKDWAKIPSFPDPNKSTGGKEVAFVIPEKYFAQLPDVMKEVPPLPGEEALYATYQSVLDAVKKDSSLYSSLVKAAVDAEKELIDPLRQFKNVGVPVGNHWATVKNGAAFGTDYLSRTAAARANIFVNQPNETIYYNQDLDSTGSDLKGTSNYTVTFSKDQVPKVKGFWSLTVYDENHFFVQNAQKVYSLGTKNKDLKINPDGSLTIYLQTKDPGGDKSKNWIPSTTGKFGLLLRAYWPEESMVKGYTPPAVVKAK